MRTIRWMCGVKVTDRFTRSELRERLGTDDKITVVQRHRLRWYRHEEGSFNRLLFSKRGRHKGPLNMPLVESMLYVSMCMPKYLQCCDSVYQEKHSV